MYKTRENAHNGRNAPLEVHGVRRRVRFAHSALFSRALGTVDIAEEHFSMWERWGVGK